MATTPEESSTRRGLDKLDHRAAPAVEVRRALRGASKPPGLEDLWRAAAPEVLATLTHRTGDFSAAEDAVADALLDATRQWPSEGVPANPTGWLVTAASRRWIDAQRSDIAREAREERVALDPGLAAPSSYDDSLAMLLLCCHPALPRASQVALTLRAVGGLSTAQIGRAFLVPEPTMAQRISRAKARLRELDAPFAVPPAAELPVRVAATCQVLYLIFTEGHTSTVGASLYDVVLADEAVRLTRRLLACLPGEGEVMGLLALMLLTDARRAARVATDGSLVPLAEQDRSRWDRALIEEGVGLVEQALPAGRVGAFQLQAAIAAVHAEAARAEDTDWAQIAVLYGMLDDLAPSPVVTLNRAVAVAMVEGPHAGLALVEPLLEDRSLARGHRLHAVRGHLLQLAGRADEALASYEVAARLATNIPEQRYLQARVDNG